MFDRLCLANGIEHKLTKPHQWTNGQGERMNRTIKDATSKAYHYPDLEELEGAGSLDGASACPCCRSLAESTPASAYGKIRSTDRLQFPV